MTKSTVRAVKLRLRAVTFGPKPEMRWVPTERCTSDRTYQRTLESRRSQRLIDKIVAEFNWAKFGAMLVTEVTYNAAPVGRFENAQPSAPAAPAAPAQSEPAVNPYALHHALVAAGDHDAVETARACAAAGVSIPRYPIPSRNLAPGQTLALAAIAWAVKCYGRPRAETALTVLMTAFHDRPGRLRAPMVKAVMALLAGGADAATLAKILRLTNEADLASDVFIWMRDRGVTNIQAHYEALKQLMSQPRSGGNRGPGAPRKTARQAAAVDHGPDVIDRLRLEEQSAPVAAGVMRRCADCGQLFVPRTVGERRCGCKTREAQKSREAGAP